MSKIFKESKWTDPISWKMDLLKSAITYVCVTVFTVLIFWFFLDRKQFQWQSQYGLKIETLKNYEKYSSLYILWSYDAFGDVCFCKTRDSSKAIQQWEDEGYDEFKISQESLKLWFVENNNAKNNIEGLLNKIDSEKKQLKSNFDDLLSQVKNKGASYCKDTSLQRQIWEAYKIQKLNPLISDFQSTNRQVLVECSKELSSTW